LPEFLRGQWNVAGVGFGVYRLFLVGVVARSRRSSRFLVERTRFGAQVRAAVDDARVAAARASTWIASSA
jgi:branched-chain amino acid transport system permease protein